MTLIPLIDDGEWPGFERLTVEGPAGRLSLRIGGPEGGPVVLTNHVLLTSSATWRRHAALLAARGFRVVCPDTRGHGLSPGSPAPYRMDDLVADNIALLDALGLGRVHFVGAALGGMTGLGLAIRRPERLASLCVFSARADAPQAFAAPWDERIAAARSQGVPALAGATAERWFGKAFLAAQPHTASALLDCMGRTSLEGFIGCARAIQGLDYLGEVGRITTPTTLVVGLRDEVMLQPTRQLASLIRGAVLEEIADAGHLPLIDQPEISAAALLRHLAAG